MNNKRIIGWVARILKSQDTSQNVSPLEKLEPRLLMSTITQNPDGTVQVVGTGGDDDVLIRPGSNPGEIQVILGHELPVVLSGVTGLNISLEGGDDRIMILKDITNADGDHIGATVSGGAGNDKILNYNSGNDSVVGGSGNDYLDNGTGNDKAEGGTGDDTLHGGDGDNTLYGESGNDLLVGGKDNDYMDGGTGEDRMFGHDGKDTMNGGADDDMMSGGIGDDQMNGEGGKDFVDGAGGRDTVRGGTEGDTLTGGESYPDYNPNEDRIIEIIEIPDTIASSAGPDPMWDSVNWEETEPWWKHVISNSDH